LRRLSTRATTALVALVLVLGAALPASWAVRGEAMERRAQVGRDLAETKAERDEVAEAIAAVEQALWSARRSHALTVTEQRAVASALNSTERHRHETSAEVDATGAELASKQQTLDSSSDYAELQRFGATELDGCIRAVMEAVSLLDADRRDEGVDRLQSVVDTCRRAEAYLSGGQAQTQFSWDFADPFVLTTGDGYVAYATNAIGGHVQAIRSPDLERWEWIGEVLPHLPAWADPHRTWAPSVIRLGDRWAMYYTARHAGHRRQCISVAFSDRPDGPFVDWSPEPLVCQHERNGSIDASPFVDVDGTPYLLWKSEDETMRGGRDGATLWSAPLTDDGSGLAFYPVELLRADRADERRTIEGPSLVWTLDGYFLLYSANRFDTADYRADFAHCAGPSGPCTKPPDNTVVGNTGPRVGPGGAEWFRSRDGGLMVAFHSWVGNEVGFPHRRVLHTAPVTIEGGRPTI
jgi:F0F1-type ATP synthase membrane subunit b/b'